MKMKKYQKLKVVLKFIAPSLIALVVEGIAILIGLYTHDKFFAGGNNACSTPAIPPTLSIAVIGVAIALFGIIKAFQQKRYLIGAIAIFLGLLSVVLGLLALFILVFQICF